MRVHGGAIVKCQNEGKVEASAYNVGGIVGYIGTTGSITKCNNSGEIQVTSFNLGGISGLSGVNIAGCYNEGKVNNEYNSLKNSTINCNVGGILGSGTSSKLIKIENCYNLGGVYFKVADYVGGILGYGAVSSLNNCYNIGEILEMDMGCERVGGIGGEIYVYDCVSCRNCCNYGDVSVHSLGIGGIINRLWASQGIMIENCYNSGRMCKIKTDKSGMGDISIAGIVTRGLGGAIRYKNCYNIGELLNNYKNDGKQRIAGITEDAFELTDCHNIGEIKGESTGDSFFYEICGGTNATLANCTYLVRSNNVNADGATGKTEEEMKPITDINKFVEKMNIAVDEHNSDNPEFMWSKWIVKDGKAVFEIE